MYKLTGRALILFLAVAGFASSAQAVVLFLDRGGPADGVRGGPLDHSNPNLNIPPGRTLVLHLWAIPDQDNAKVIAALGHRIRVTGSAAPFVSVAAYTFENPLLSNGQPRWSGIRPATLNGANGLVEDQRAVFVPAAAPFLGGVGAAVSPLDPGYDANSGAVHLAELVISVAGNAPAGASAELRLAVSPLLIAAVTTGTWAPEPVFFGYAPSGPEPGDGTGSQVDATSTLADAVLHIVTPGDVDADGDVDLLDYQALANCLAGPSVASSGDCAPADMNGDARVDLRDFAILQLALRSSAQRPGPSIE